MALVVLLVSMEIDLEILDMLISAAPTTEYWSALNNNVWNGNGFTQTGAGSPTAAGDGFYNTQGGWFCFWCLRRVGNE